MIVHAQGHHKARGLSLIEVLASAVLLSIVAGACVSLLRSAQSSIDGRNANIDVTTAGDRLTSMAALEHFADEFVREDGTVESIARDAHGDNAIAVAAARVLTEDGESIGVTVQFLHAADTQADHVWIAFQAGGHIALRYVAITRDAAQQGGGNK